MRNSCYIWTSLFNIARLVITFQLTIHEYQYQYLTEVICKTYGRCESVCSKWVYLIDEVMLWKQDPFFPYRILGQRHASSRQRSTRGRKSWAKVSPFCPSSPHHPISKRRILMRSDYKVFQRINFHSLLHSRKSQKMIAQCVRVISLLPTLLCALPSKSPMWSFWMSCREMRRRESVSVDV